MAKPKKSNRGANMQRRRDDSAAESRLLALYQSEDTERSAALLTAIADAWPWFGGAAYCGGAEDIALLGPLGGYGALVIDNGAGDFGLPPRGAVKAVYLNLADAMAASLGLVFDDGGPKWPKADDFVENMRQCDPLDQAVIAVRYGPGDCVHFHLAVVDLRALGGDLYPPLLYERFMREFDDRYDKPHFWFAKEQGNSPYALVIRGDETD